MEPATPARSADPSRHRGPSLAWVAITYVVLFVASLVIPTAMAGGSHFPSPFDSVDTSARYFNDHAFAVQIAAFLQFGAAIPLGIFGAAASSRVQFLGMKVAGINIALFGGIAAATFQASSALLAWVLSQSTTQGTTGSAHALHLLCFAAGGPAFVAMFGLLLAGISVTAGLQRLVSRGLATLGLVIAVVAEFSSLVLIAPSTAILLPIARFTGLVWMIWLGLALPKSRTAVAR